jgi:hypothetical protein
LIIQGWACAKSKAARNESYQSRIAEFGVFFGVHAPDYRYRLKGGCMKIVETCSICNQDKTIETRRAKPFSNVVTTNCGCGYDVQVVAFLDIEKCCSSYPLEGFTRDAMHEKHDDFRYVIGQTSGFTGGEYVPA